MTYRYLCLSAALFSTAMTPLAIAQDIQDEIIVTGTRLNQTSYEVGSSVSVITANDLDTLGFDFVVDALASAPGVTINQNGAFGGVASVRIRGASSEQTLVLVDGLAVNDTSAPGGGYDFSRFDPENIERIEILKGPHSTLWGSDAIGGVVSITTKRAEDGLHGSLFGEYGSFNTFRAGASLNGAIEGGDFRLSVTGIDSDGLSKADEANGNTEEDGYTSYTFSGRGGVNFPGGARLDLTALYTDAETEFDSFVFGAQGNVGDGDEVSETEEFSANLSLQLPLLDDRFENLFLIGYSDIERQNFTNGAFGFGAEGDRTLLRYQGTFKANERHSVAFGAEHEDTTANDDDASITGYFALYEFKPVEKLTLTGGVRVDDHTRFGSETTARVAAAYNPNEQITLRGSWGQGFKAPTIFQTTFFCCGATAPNADVLPENSDAFDFSAEFRTQDGRGEIGVTYFDQSVENLISFSFAIGGYENIPGAETSGIEAFASYQFTDWLGLGVNYAYIDAQDNQGNTLIRVPEHSGEVTVSLDPEGPVSGAILVRYNGEEDDFNGTVDDWLRVDLTASYDLGDNVEVYGRVENLFDENYQQILGYGTPGLSGSFGVRLRY